MKVRAFAAVALLLVAACGSSSPSPGVSTKPPPNQGMTPQSSIGAGEGALNLIDWGGYVQSLWQAPFE